LTDGGSRRRGRGQGQRLLYWFRTPPGVRVGRAAIDEQAMRLLEEHNPDVDFDWPRLLKEVPQEGGPRRDRDRDRDRDPRDRDRRDRRDARPAPRPRAADTTAAAVPPSPPPIVRNATADIAEERADAHAAIVMGSSDSAGSDSADSAASVDEAEAAESVAVFHREPLGADHAEYVEYAHAAHAPVDVADAVEHAAPEEPGYRAEPTEPVSAAAERLGRDGVVRLRARYTQIVGRLAEKPMNDEARLELNARVERLNPDAWRTAEEVAAALEQYEAVFESLRAEVGRHPRRTV
jgi:hypothetical protein